jgi:hypothetical protein
VKKVLLVWMVLVLAGTLVACDDDDNWDVGSPTYRVKYKVGGTTSQASLTYQNAQGGTEQMDVRVPWEKTIGTVQKGDFLYLSAQNYEASGSITCEIWVDGRMWKHSISSGAYVIASCNGSAGRD